MRFRQIDICAYSAPCGQILLASCAGQLCLCDWLNNPRHEVWCERLERSLSASLVEGASSLLDRVRRQLDEYFARTRSSFDIPLHYVGTPFQQRVWSILTQISYGARVSYGVIADHLGSPRAVRAVAQAIASNGLSIVVPCHRVVGRNGRLTGYAGGIIAKSYLLSLEEREEGEPLIFQ